ncbi:uncharacterized protein LOC114355340 [Ostrinia furnacalis]|uniref:uncharacterized protein LOC114355340 n=1 Tax=Ostrinia furnacalis TaxID=93504 RepID=UPI00103B5DB8|nr:uncharacterized protein LOC114355340 [Ostrinia furnacalis]
MHYLKSLLTGEAEQLVRHIPITAGNYKQCWSQLSSRYKNKRFLSNTLLKRLISQPNVVESSTAIKGLLDTTVECLNGLQNLSVDISTWDIIIIYIIGSKLDAESRKQWESKISSNDSLPKFSEFKEFLEARFRALEFLDPKANIKSKQNSTSHYNKPKVMHVINNDDNSKSVISCSFCKENHKIANCKQFAKESYDSRHSFVQNNGLCFNCLGSNHSIKYCRTNSTCRICNKKHHSLLHPKSNSNFTATTKKFNSAVEVNTAAVSTVQAQLSEGEPTTSNVVTHFSKESMSVPTQVLLATALVEAQTSSGYVQLLRVLLDQGSQASFITESAVQLLGLKKIPVKSVITGIGGDQSSLASRFVVMVTIQSRLDPKFSVQVRAYVLSTITSLLPSEKLHQCQWPEFQAVTLADPEFHTPSKVDMLLGAEIYGLVLREGIIKGPRGTPTAQNTVLGWILSGQTGYEQNNIHCHHVVSGSTNQADDDELLRQFWEIESIVPKRILSEDEQRCEEIYKATTSRDQSGRYVVNLPFRSRDPKSQYGNSRELAIKRFLLLENKFKRQPQIKERYSEVIHEYLELGHMQRIDSRVDSKRDTAVYLPHHAVIREDKSTTKVRIVFDASMKGSNGVSLNDDLLVGPTLQPPLRHTIMRWRMHPIIICADIIKMYRQVKVSDEHSDFQRIVWRDNPDSELEEYRLQRVTFGTASAPYLAVKTLQQVAEDDGQSCPEIREIVKRDFYVDDLMSGCQSIEQGLMIKEKITELLDKSGFQLQKWISNDQELNQQISDTKGEKETQLGKDIKIDDVIKILGLSWDRDTDKFKYSVQLPTQQTPITKRRVISDISRLYDPLGWVSPCVIVSKIFIQKLWLSGIDWDEELPAELLDEWQAYRCELEHISKCQIPRWVATCHDDKVVELHGFCDASIAAYAAVVYVRVIDVQGEVKVSLVTSRTKVAPVKQQSIPRLELMGAALLVELITEVAEVMNVPKSSVRAWTDSSVVLAWLSGHPSRWTTFVGNRVSHIISLLDNTHWAHVTSSQNPADIASRGLTPQELHCNELWIQGPLWLQEETITYTRPKSISTNMEERALKSHVVTDNVPEDKVWTKFSSLHRLVRVIAFCKRFLNLTKKENKKNQHKSYLTSDEISEALKICTRQCQRKDFLEEIEDLKRTGKVKNKSKLKCLNPILDKDDILRVGGRITNAQLDDDVKNPIIIPQKNHFTYLLVDDAHKKTLHGGPSVMLNYLRSKYWIISGKNVTKAHVRKCVTCVRHAAVTKPQIMGQLPSCRVTPARAFLRSGVDFAGPISIRMSKGRGSKSYKGYVCLFVCMVTRAIHLEVVSDLTSEGFIAGFKRFVSRRGLCREIWSDNGTNFVGASRELHSLIVLERSSVALEIRSWLNDNSVTWHFIPPHAPNFGGLWEAGVKSTKFHLRRVISDSTLTFEEMTTLLSQIEACLNSRPISQLPSNCEDPMPLTPGHFLIGEPLVTVPDRDYLEMNIGSLRRWQVTQRMLQGFWRRWSNEYLLHMLQRYKWTNRTPEPVIGDIILVKEDNLPPARWLMGKVVEKHPGLDGVTRVVSLKCNGSIIKRPTSKLCILPVKSETF